MSELTLTLTQLTDGSYLLESGQSYVLEPGEVITIRSGETEIRLQYIAAAEQTDIRIEASGEVVDHTFYDSDEEDDEDDIEPTDEQLYSTGWSSVTVADEHGRQWTTHADGTTTVSRW